MQVFERRPGDAFALIATIDTTNRFPQMLRCDRELIAWNTDGNQLLYSLPPFIDATSIATRVDRRPFRVQFPNVRSGDVGWFVGRIVGPDIDREIGDRSFTSALAFGNTMS